MPTFRVWHLKPPEDDVFWVYAIDDWDARHQVKETLNFDAFDQTAFGCTEDDAMRAPLNHVVHKNGKFSICPTPEATGKTEIR